MEIRRAVGAVTLAVLCFPGDVLGFTLTTIKPGVGSAAASSTGRLITGPHAFGPEYVYIGHKILMKQPHDIIY